MKEGHEGRKEGKVSEAHHDAQPVRTLPNPSVDRK
jgi:hypothetical protein